jgi:molybdopterin-guanine dinucleotide biosynthesis protein A
VPVRRAVDPERHGGPLVGLLAGLEVAGEPVAIVVGGDMPTLSPTVLAVLVRALGATDGADAAVLVQRGATRPLPLAIRNGAASQAARRLIGEGERSLRRLLDALSARRLDEVEWRGLDPDGATLRDVDRPEDLAGMPRVGRRT